MSGSGSVEVLGLTPRVGSSPWGDDTVLITQPHGDALRQKADLLLGGARSPDMISARFLGVRHLAPQYGAVGYGELLSGRTVRSLPDSQACLLYTSPSPRDGLLSRMPSSA